MEDIIESERKRTAPEWSPVCLIFSDGQLTGLGEWGGAEGQTKRLVGR